MRIAPRLRLAFLCQMREQLPCQGLGRRGADLPALAAHTRRDGQDLPGYPVSSPVLLAIKLAGDAVAWWVLVPVKGTGGDSGSRVIHPLIMALSRASGLESWAESIRRYGRACAQRACRR